MAVLKHRLRKRNSSGTYDIIHIETDWECITNKPSTFPPSAHQHTPDEAGSLPITGGVLTGDLRIRSSDTSNRIKLKFGDGEYLWISKDPGDIDSITISAEELRFICNGGESISPLPIEWGGTGANNIEDAISNLCLPNFEWKTVTPSNDTICLVGPVLARLCFIIDIDGNDASIILRGKDNQELHMKNSQELSISYAGSSLLNQPMCILISATSGHRYQYMFI